MAGFMHLKEDNYSCDLISELVTEEYACDLNHLYDEEVSESCLEATGFWSVLPTYQYPYDIS